MGARRTLVVFTTGLLVVAIPAGGWIGRPGTPDTPKAFDLAQVAGYVRLEASDSSDRSAYVLWRSATSASVTVVRIDARTRVTKLPALGRTGVGVIAPLTVWRGRPCVGANRQAGSRVACLENGEWGSTPLPVGASGQSVMQLVPNGGGLVALLRDDNRPNEWAAWKMNRDRWSELPALPRHGAANSDLLVHVAGGTGSASRDLFAGIVSGGHRAVYRLEDDRWAPHTRPTPFRGLPTQNSAPWSDGTQVLFARTELATARWPFFVDSASQGESLRPSMTTPLNRRRNSAAQGRLFDLAGDPWVIWQEATGNATPKEQVAIFGARLSATGKVLRLQRVGPAYRSVGPAALSLVEVGGAPYAVIARSRPTGSGRVITTISVERLRSS